MTKKILLSIFICSSLFITQAQSVKTKPVANKIEQAKLNQQPFVQSKPFTKNLLIDSKEKIDAFVTKSVVSSLDLASLKQIQSERNEFIELTIPYLDGEEITLQLYEAHIFAENFSVKTSDGLDANYQPGIYYRGIIKGDPNSLAAISIFNEELMGIISSNDKGNINIGKLKTEGALKNDYIIYSDRDLLVENSGSCNTVEDERFSDSYKENLGNDAGSRTINIPEVYLEADYQLYQNKGSVILTSDYLTGVFNNSATIYSNDGIDIVISEIFVWTSSDGYASYSSYAALTAFMGYRTTFNGDIAHLCALDAGGLGGVAATINGLCNSNKYCYSDIDATYSSFPTYSWTVMVFTHEMGHLFGSYHTQWCGWPGGAIDNCYTTEGGCAGGAAPVTGGTIMSYCHLTGYGINFNNGFGPYPTDAIIDAIEAAPCLTGGGGGTVYCASEGSISNEEWIDKVKLGTINRTSGDDGGYYDGTALSTNLKKGTTKNFKVSVGMVGGPFNEFYKIWIDWNHDFDFDDAGEEIYNYSAATTAILSGTFVVPTTATLGSTRMRVSIKYDAAPGSCEVFSYGEVEDYTVNITAALPGELLAAESEISIYPNPVSETLFVQWNEMKGEEISLAILDMTGNIISENKYKMEAYNALLNLENLPAGVYLIKIVSNVGEFYTEQIIKN